MGDHGVGVAGHGEMTGAATEAPPPERVTSEEMAETSALARLMVQSLSDAVKYYKREYGFSAEKALEAATGSNDFWENEFMTQPVDRVSWREFDCAFEVNPERALARWQEIKKNAMSARHEGDASADVIEGHDASPWQRARFLSIRWTLLEDWKPVGTELLLVDLMAEAFFEVERWTRIMAGHVTLEASCMTEDRRGGILSLPRITQAAAIDQAGQQVDRWNRIFLRNLRALRDLRRSSVIINNHPGGQVNIGEKQVNVSMDRGEE